ncbi:hypothetical protein SAMN04489712_1362 [Thermomonospora echinospora]|uniref:WD40-like Beta Propeller Repeat n=1 Tax=Thermomonospora echinospora TaxID=1992 RepID=A0A1H6E5C5_9ACTN|nr:hypothetical protein [Thermomonospora echinospora]SEG92890.1 hypothetical protein SAMN04489712_1362 [Thermomonospora echinospora]
MGDRSWDVVIDALPERRVERACLVLGLHRRHDTVVAVLDADAGEFVRVPEIEDGLHSLALYRDGTRLLLGRSGGGHSLLTLATGWRQPLPGEPGLAAPSPDGRDLAVLSPGTDEVGDDTVSVSVSRIGTPGARRLWRAPGGWSEESAINWSPDGRLLAATYLDPDEEIAAVILDAADGTVLGHHPQMGTVGGPGGAWLSERGLLLYDEYAGDDEAWTLQDPYNGGSRGPDRLPGALMAVVGDRIIRYVHDAGFLRFVTTDMDGGGLRPFITVPPGSTFWRLDVAPPVLLELWAAAASR